MRNQSNNNNHGTKHSTKKEQGQKSEYKEKNSTKNTIKKQDAIKKQYTIKKESQPTNIRIEQIQSENVQSEKKLHKLSIQKSTSQISQKLAQDTTKNSNAIIGGVCSRIATFLSLPTWLVRATIFLLTVISVIVDGGIMIILYCLAWLIFPHVICKSQENCLKASGMQKNIGFGLVLIGCLILLFIEFSIVSLIVSAIGLSVAVYGLVQT